MEHQSGPFCFVSCRFIHILLLAIFPFRSAFQRNISNSNDTYRLEWILNLNVIIYITPEARKKERTKEKMYKIKPNQIQWFDSRFQNSKLLLIWICCCILVKYPPFYPLLVLFFSFGYRIIDIHRTIQFNLVTNLWDYVIHETDTDDIKLYIKPFVSMIFKRYSIHLIHYSMFWIMNPGSGSPVPN